MYEVMMMEVLFNFTVGGAGRESFQTHHGYQSLWVLKYIVSPLYP